MEPKDKRAAYSIMEYLQSAVDTNKVKTDDAESLSVAIQCIGEAFGVSLDSEEDKSAYLLKPTSLPSILDVFVQTQKKKQDSPKQPSTESSLTPPSEQDKARAEELKAQGNRKLTEKNFDEAIDLYTQALHLDPNNVIYLSNRAAAYSQAGNHDLAVTDCEKAINIDPAYSKAYSRLGLAFFSLNEYEKAVDAYKKGLALDPHNAIMKQSLETAEQRAAKSRPVVNDKDIQGTTTARSGADMPGLGGAGGGMPDLGSLLNNPALMQMASQMMQNPQTAQMLQGLMGGAGGAGGGGAGGLSAMMNNPQIRNMAQQFMSDPSAMQNLMGSLGGGDSGSPNNSSSRKS